jgi:alanine-synthesizing transaminase
VGRADGAGRHQSIDDLVQEGGRLRVQRDLAWELINAIPGVSCVKPGALYMFPRLDPEVYPSRTTRSSSSKCCRKPRSCWCRARASTGPSPDHFRIVFLPHEADLREAINRWQPSSKVPQAPWHGQAQAVPAEKALKPAKAEKPRNSSLIADGA